MPRPSKAAGSVALVTGANRGIGLAFVQELAARGARKVYAKAAALFLSSITRSELADQGTEVIALIVGSVDTRMAAHVQGRKEDPRDIARAGLAGIEERAKEHGVRIAVQTQAMGRNIVQFHPLDVGVLLELDEFLPRTGWFWDDLETARAAQASRSAKVDNIVAVDVAVHDPAEMAATWAALIGIAPPAKTLDGAEVAFASRTIRFVPAAGGRTGIVAIDMHATDREHGAGGQGELCHTLIRFV